MPAVCLPWQGRPFWMAPVAVEPVAFCPIRNMAALLLRLDPDFRRDPTSTFWLSETVSELLSVKALDSPLRCIAFWQAPELQRTKPAQLSGGLWSGRKGRRPALQRRTC